MANDITTVEYKWFYGGVCLKNNVKAMFAEGSADCIRYLKRKNVYSIITIEDRNRAVDAMAGWNAHCKMLGFSKIRLEEITTTIKVETAVWD